MNQINSIKPVQAEPADISRSGQSFLQKVAGFGKSFASWEGHDVSQINPAEFLRKEAPWTSNLRLLAQSTSTLSLYPLMTKEIYSWLPKDGYIKEGFESITEQKAARTSRFALQWMQGGIALGMTYAFTKAVIMNFVCLGTTDELSCRLQYNETLSQQSLIAKVAMATGLWFLGGLMICNLGDLGLRGYIKEKQMTNELFDIIKSSLESANAAFWSAVDAKDRATAQKIYDCLRLIKSSANYRMTFMNLHLGISKADYNSRTRGINILLDDILTHDFNALFPLPVSAQTVSETAVQISEGSTKDASELIKRVGG